jgi:hypothetical protein
MPKGEKAMTDTNSKYFLVVRITSIEVGVCKCQTLSYVLSNSVLSIGEKPLVLQTIR